MFTAQDRIISIEVHQTNIRQGENTYVVSAITEDGIPKSYQFIASQTDKVEFWKEKARDLGLEVTIKHNYSLPMASVIEDHSTFNRPDDQQTIWRYMSFSKFMSLVSSGRLWFARADILQASDPMEGRVPDAQVEANNEFLRSMNLVPMTDGCGNEVHSSGQRGEHSVVMNARHDYFERYHTYINCWHVGNVENFAMWRVYGEDSNCLAIKSTVGDLRRALGKSDNYRIYAGKMNYVDYSDPEIFKQPMPNGFTKYLNKSLYYKYEDELRLIFSDHGAVSDLIPNKHEYHMEPDEREIKKIPAGVRVPIDVKALVNEIVLGPDCEPWFVEMLQGLVKSETIKEMAERLVTLNLKQSEVKDYQIPNPPDINW
jgi:hypothetical protein